MRYEKMIKGKFLTVVISYRWLKYKKKFAPNIDQDARRKVRRAMTFSGSLENSSVVQRSK